MSIGEPACLRRVFDHHVVRQAMPPCERLCDLPNRNGRTTAETKLLTDQEFQLAGSVLLSCCLFLHAADLTPSCGSGDRRSQSSWPHAATAH
jgi:hypothetical protein